MNTTTPAVDAIFPLSPSQHGMLLESLGSAPGLHVEQALFDLRGPLELETFRAAWQAVVERHAILRTSFLWKTDADPVQVTLRDVKVPLQRLAWIDQTQAERKAQYEQFLAADRALGFNPKRAPLLRLALIEIGIDHYHFVFTFHHILLDGWSVALVLRDALAVYETLRGGGPLPQTTPPSFRSFIAWQRNQDAGKAREYWSEYLRGFSQAHPLSINVAEAPPDREEGHGEVVAPLSAEITRMLTLAAREHRVTPGLVFQAAWGLLLSRYAKSNDVVFGTTVSGRPSSLEGALEMVGLFINTVPMRLGIEPGNRFWRWLAEVQQRGASGRDYEHCSSGQIHRWSKHGTSESLYESLLVFENYPEDRSGLGNASLRVDILESRTLGARTTFPIVFLIGSGREFSIKLIYRHDRIPATSAHAIVGDMAAVVEAIATQPDPTLEDLTTVIADDRVPLVYEHRPTLSSEMRRFVGPRDTVELQLALLWQDILGQGAIGIYDSFFELGGHSLLALDLMGKIHEALGVRLPMATLLEHPSIAAIASQIRQQGGSRAWTPLVPIRTKGRRSRFFCVPGAAIDAISLYPLARALGDEHPFYGIQPRGLDGLMPPHATVEAMAGAAVEVMLETQERGPYFIGGHSFGAHVAFEASQQLRDAGHEVALLALVDAEASSLSTGRVSPTRDNADRLARLVSLIQRFFGRTVSLSLSAADLPPEDLLEHVSTKLAEAQILPVDMGAERVRNYLTVGEATSLAFDAYKATARHPVRTIVFRARETHQDDVELGVDTADASDGTLGWSALVGQDIQTHWVPGDHVSIMTPPHVDAIATILRRVMRGRP